MTAPSQFTFSVGVWNLHEGADPFGPPVRPERSFAEKLAIFKAYGFDYVQFHDDDAVPADVTGAEVERQARDLKRLLDDEGMKTEFIAPRIWEDPATVDGAITANCPKSRQWALDKGKRAVDIARIMETDRIVVWPAREGTYIREAKDPVRAHEQLLDWYNALLDYDANFRFLSEAKPNEPMDLMYVPTTGHMLAFSYRTQAPERCGVLIESAHAILAGLDPSDEMGNAIFHDKLWGVHLNDQNGLKFDEDKTFGSANLRRAFNQVDVLVQHGYGKRGEVVGLDVKAMRTQPAELSALHLKNSREMVLLLEELSNRIDRTRWAQYVEALNYEALDMFILRSLLGKE